jgi:hypothetical protein
VGKCPSRARRSARLPATRFVRRMLRGAGAAPRAGLDNRSSSRPPHVLGDSFGVRRINADGSLEGIYLLRDKEDARRDGRDKAHERVHEGDRIFPQVRFRRVCSEDRELERCWVVGERIIEKLAVLGFDSHGMTTVGIGPDGAGSDSVARVVSSARRTVLTRSPLAFPDARS